MTLLTPYPKLRYDFEMWLNEADSFPRHFREDFTRSFWLSIQPEPLKHFYLTLYAESVGWKIREYLSVDRLWRWSISPKDAHIAVFDTFPAAFERFARLRELELKNNTK